MNGRGFATMTAMAMVLLVAMVAAALTARFAADARLTQKAEGEAQLRQLLLAGSIAAREGADEVVLPEALVAEGAGVTIERVGDGARVRAMLSHGWAMEMAVERR